MRLFAIILLMASAIYASPLVLSRCQNPQVLSAKRPTLMNRAAHPIYDSVALRVHEYRIKCRPFQHPDVHSIALFVKNVFPIDITSTFPLYRPRSPYEGTTPVIVRRINALNDEEQVFALSRIWYYHGCGLVTWGVTDEHVYFIVIRDDGYLSEAEVLEKHPNYDLAMERKKTRDRVYENERGLLQIGTVPEDFVYKFVPPSSYEAIWV